MALFFVNKPPHEGTLKENLIVTHKTHPLIATAWEGPTSVLITDNEGEVLTVVQEPATGAAATNKSLTCTSLTWHPTEKLLLIGWSSGKLTLWSMPVTSSLGISDDQGASSAGYANSTLQALAAKAALVSDVEGAVREHSAGAVVVTEWTTNGQYLLSASSQKAVVVWVLERTVTDRETSGVAHTLKPLWAVDSEAPIVQAIHVPDTSSAVGVNKSTVSQGEEVSKRDADEQAGTPGDEVAFLLTDGSNRIYYLNDEQKIGTCVAQDDRIIAMLYDSRLRLMVTLNATYFIDVSRLADDFVIQESFRRKLSTPSPSATGEKFTLSMVWASSGVVAFGCGDDRVRIFDLSSESMYMVPFPVSSAHISYVATEASRGMLAVGTAEGTLAIFQSSHAAAATANGTKQRGSTDATSRLAVVARAATPGSAGGDLSSNWEPVSTHELGEHVDRIVFTPLGDMAVCIGGGKLQVLHETVRKRAWDGVAAATQISADMVVIESVTGCQCLLKSKSKVRGLSVFFPTIALWSGSQIDIYTINETTSTYTLVNFVPTTSPAFAVHHEGLFYVKDGRIVFATLQLQHIAQLAFTEAEGVPVLIDVMNDFLVAVSSKNVLRLAKISTRDLHPLGPSRPIQLVPDADTNTTQRAGKGPITIAAARVNAQGRCVALMTKVGTVGEPDTRIWVYNADTDKISSFDFAPRNELPEAVYWNTPEPNANSFGELEFLLLACETRQLKSGLPTGTSAVLAQQQQQQQTNREGSGANASTTEAKKPPTSRRASHPHHEDLPEAMPDMENFADKEKQPDNTSRRGSLGATNFIADRAHNIVTLFATRSSLVVHNSVSLKRYQICLVGLTIPDFLLASVKINGNPSNAEDYVIEQKRLRDFDGLKSDKDVVVREALMKFSYYSTIGNMDEAYRCIKTIKNPAAWQGLARMCVTNGRLDVAAVCLATMQDGVAARALREAREEYPNDKNLQLATLACSLNMMGDCEALLNRSQRYDIITDVFLACGKFEQAQRHSECFDRMRIRAVAYKYAQFMESLQNMDAAVMWYYNAHCAVGDVPRIYYQTNRLAELRDLVMPPNSSSNANSATPGSKGAGASTNGRSTDDAATRSTTSDDPRSTFSTLFANNKELLLWWAQHSERRHNIQEALRFYHAGNDVYNVVRLLCSLKPPKIENAVEIVNAEVAKAKAKFDQQQSMAAAPEEVSSSVAEPARVGAAFFVGQHFEKAGDAAMGLKYYKYAGAYRSGVRVARKSGSDADVLSLSLASTDPRLMLENALYFSRRGAYEKSVELYRKVGATQLALDDCIKGGLYDTLHDISTTLANSSTDPAVFLSMAMHFQSCNQHQKAVEMLVFAKHYNEALQMCQEHNVILTEEMAEAMTGEKSELPQEEKTTLLKRVAQIAKDQGSWSLACKKYTQAGDRLKALKMLMRGGETEKVIFFANHSRNVEIYTLAANFLQSQSWSTDANVYKHIVLFYTKAKVFDSLISFGDSCAQMRIDEHRDYPAALKAVEECIRIVEKATAGKGGVNEGKFTQFKERADILRGFVKAQQLVDSLNISTKDLPEQRKKADEVIAICSDYVKRSRPTSPDHALIEEAIRIGDVFALLVKYYFDKLGDSKNALKVLESMPRHGAEAQLYLEMDYIEKVCKANGKQLADVVVINAGGDTVMVQDRRRGSNAPIEEEMRIH